jgi:hypothetical protein
MILNSTLCFWTIQGLEFANVLTDGGRQMAQYPMTIYRDWFRRIFTYVAVCAHQPYRFAMSWHVEQPTGLSRSSRRDSFVVPCPADLETGSSTLKICGSLSRRIESKAGRTRTLAILPD